MEETWMEIPEFPNYQISSYGRVRNHVRRQPVALSLTQQGAVKVNLFADNKHYTRSVKRLVAENFVPGHTFVFDTPIHLDGDQQNNRADNLVWRPRWFAGKYSHQFRYFQKYVGMGPLVDRKTGVMYQDVYEAATRNGLLFEEVELALVNKVPVFPTWHLFDIVR